MDTGGSRRRQPNACSVAVSAPATPDAWIPNGFLYFIDRLKEVITVHSYKVYPRIVEDAIRLHPAVAEVAVIGVTDPRRGHAPKAFVVPTQGALLTDEALRAFLADKLSAIETPRFIEFRASLPKSAAGKTLKQAL